MFKIVEFEDKAITALHNVLHAEHTNTRYHVGASILGLIGAGETDVNDPKHDEEYTKIYDNIMSIDSDNDVELSVSASRVLYDVFSNNKNVFEDFVAELDGDSDLAQKTVELFAV